MTFPVAPEVFQIGPVSIHWYGLLVVVGILLGYLVCRYVSRYTRHVSRKEFDNLFFWLIVWGFVGARLYHVLNEPVYYWSHPVEVLKIWNGGLAIHGAILAGVIVICYFVRRIVIPDTDLGSRNKKQKEFGPFGFLDSSLRWNDRVRSFFSITDLLVIGLALGQAIGRWGNYFNQELFGKPTDGFFKVIIDIAYRPAGFETVVHFHPTFFYESLLNVILFIVLYVIYTRMCHCEEVGATKQSSVFLGKRENGKTSEDRHTSLTLVRDDNNTGLTTSIYLIGYGLIRFFIDFLRIDPRPFLGGLYLSQWVSLLMIALGIVIWYNARKGYDSRIV